MKMYIIRHGETPGDLEDRYGGSYDDHLTDKGKEQLRLAADNLKDKGIEVIFSSPLIRAREASEIIQEKVGAPIKYINELQERHYGILTGLTKKEAKEKYPNAVEFHKDPQNTDPEGESYEDFNRRVINAFKFVAVQEYQTIAIISHGGPIKAIYRFLGNELHHSIGDGEVLELEVHSIS